MFDAFSILGRIVGTATAPACERRADDTLPFSILGRIVGTATRGRRNRSSPEAILSVSSVGSWALQPASAHAMHVRVGRLSVSSVGSWALQPSATPHHRAHPRAFSILGRIVGTATDRGGNLARVTASFQYPRSDRGHCNRQPSAGPLPGRPTFSILGRIVGTATRIVNYTAIRAGTAFQYPRSDRGHCNSLLLHLLLPGYVPFSILGRIVGTATQSGAVADTLLVSFQYPRSDRGHCNARRSLAASGDAGFQYPRSDRGHCNTMRDAAYAALLAAFSILGRIVGTATS